MLSSLPLSTESPLHSMLEKLSFRSACILSATRTSAFSTVLTVKITFPMLSQKFRLSFKCLSVLWGNTESIYILFHMAVLPTVQDDDRISPKLS